MAKKKKKLKKEPKPEIVVMVVTVNNSGITNESTANARFGIGWMLGANGIKSVSYTYDGHPISLARNEAIETFLKSPHFSHLYFIDSDQVPKADVVIRLLQHDKPVVSGWYLDRGGHGVPVVLKIVGKDLPKNMKYPLVYPEKFPEWRAYTLEELLMAPKDKKTGLVQVDGVGAGCLLIRRDALSHLEKPYFYEDHQKIHSFGEDLWFGLNCKLHKVPIYVDVNCFAEHWSYGLIGMRHVQALLQRAQRMKMQQKLQKK